MAERDGKSYLETINRSNFLEHKIHKAKSWVINPER